MSEERPLASEGMTFKVGHDSVTLESALAAAALLEREMGEIANGKRRPGKLSMEPMVQLVQFVRNTEKELAVLTDYVERSTHWQEGGASRHDAKQALGTLLRGPR